jgi:hypothetical protein
MSSANKKFFLAAGWIVLVLLIALFVPVVSTRGWLLTSVVAFGPAIAMLYFARDQRQSMSESIHHARR